MKFTKMHGAGNDFIIINNIEEKIPEEKLPVIVKKLCARRLSIGADGVMVVSTPLVGGDYRMLFYNADGSLGEMCGNGARCICRYGHDHGLAKGDTQRVETTAGIVTGVRIDERYYRIRLNDPTVIKPDMVVSLDGKDYACTYIELGDPGLPHAIFYMPDYDKIPRRELFDLGQKLRFHKDFHKGANATFCQVIGENQLMAETFERGVEDFTLACGTGAGSTALANTLAGRVSGKDTLVRMPGGDLYVTVEFDGDRAKNIFLTGPTNVVAVGEVIDEDLEY